MRTMSKIRYLIISLGTSLLSICFFLVQPAAAQAAPNWGSSAIQKALLAGVAYCYQENGIVSEITNINTFNFSTNFVVGLSGEDDIALPSGLTLINDNGLSCKQLLFGYGGSGNNSFPGILSLSGKGPGANTDSKSAFLKGMGYTEKAKEGTESQQCVKLFYTETIEGTEKSSTVETDAICGTLDKEGYIEKLKIIPDSGTYFGYAGDFFAITDDGKIQFISYPGVEYVYGGYSIPKPQPKTSRGVGSTWSDFVTDLRQVASSSGDFSKTHYDVTRKYSYVPSADGNLVAQNEKIYTIKSGSKSAKNAMLKYLSNGNIENLDQLVLSKQEAISLLAGSIKEYFYNKVDINSYWVCDVANWADYGSFSPDYEIHIAPDGTYNKNCRLNPNLATGSPNTIYGLGSTRSFDASGKTKLTLQQAVQKINEYVGKIEDETPEGEEPSTSNPIAPGENSNGEEPNCFNSAGALGWVLCPVLNFVGETAYWFYGGIISDGWLQVTTEEVGRTQEVWRSFQNFANIIFAIALLVVILSQVTGFGVSNYGIKKVLPSLVMVAILVNLSFIICQIAVDVSNILGDAILGLFDGMTALEDLHGAGAIINGLLGTIGTAAIGGGLIFTVEIAGTMNISAILIPLVMVFISVFISILFFFLLLAVRRAGILILIVLSPIAIICYALPNTKNLFDRWRKLFISLLMIYPICSLLMGAGHLFSDVLLGINNGFFSALTALLIQVLPFFMIPSLVRGSLALAGNIGARISAMGARLGKTASGVVGHSELMRRLGNRADGWQMNRGLARSGGPARKGLLGAIDRVHNSPTATKNRNRRYARTAESLLSQAESDHRNARLLERDLNQTIEDRKASIDRAFDEQLIEDSANQVIATGRLDGQAFKFDDAEQLDTAFKNALSEYVNAAPDSKESKQAGLKAKMLQRVMEKRRGKDAYFTAADAIDEVYRGTTSSDTGKRKALNDMASRMLGDGKIADVLHKENPVLEKAMQNITRNDEPMSPAEKLAHLRSKLKLEGVGGLDSSVYNMLRSDEMKALAGTENYNAIAHLLSNAWNNPRAGLSIKESDLKAINEVRAIASNASPTDQSLSGELPSHTQKIDHSDKSQSSGGG